MTCEGGVDIRTRRCAVPAPANGGRVKTDPYMCGLLIYDVTFPLFLFPPSSRIAATWERAARAANARRKLVRVNETLMRRERDRIDV